MNDNIKEIGTDYSIVHSQTEHMKVMTRNELRVTGEPLNNIISDKEQGKGGGYEPQTGANDSNERDRVTGRT